MNAAREFLSRREVRALYNIHALSLSVVVLFSNCRVLLLSSE